MLLGQDANALKHEVLLSKQILVASGTATAAGVDMRDYVGTVKLILSWADAASGGSHGLNINLLDSSDNTTFTTLTTPTFSTQTASSGSATASFDTRACKRYLQARHVVTGTTATFTTSLIAVGFKQVL